MLELNNHGIQRLLKYHILLNKLTFFIYKIWIKLMSFLLGATWISIYLFGQQCSNLSSCA